MKRTLVLPIGLALGAMLFAARPALALTNLFMPLSGERLVGNATYYEGEAILTATQFSGVDVGASLGHAQGGYNSFIVYGYGNGQTVTCTVHTVYSLFDGTGADTTASSSIVGPFQIRLDTNLAAGDVSYTIECSVPAGFINEPVFIFGVDPLS
jgi:hypothetical protein